MTEQLNSTGEALIRAIDAPQRQQVEAQTQDYILLAEKVFKRKFPSIPVLFDLSGRNAGMYKVVGRHRCIRYNPWIFAKYFDENLAGTVPHEVAHFIVDQLYGLNRVKPHGREWRKVMAIFEADASVTFDLDLQGVPQRRQQRYRYVCRCREHQLSTTRHNRMRRGAAVYHCLSCKGELRPQQGN